MENNGTETDWTEKNRAADVRLSETMKGLESAVRNECDRLESKVAVLKLELDHANTAAADAHEQLRQERDKIASVLSKVIDDSERRVEEANAKANVEIANRAALEAFVAGIKAQCEGFELPTDALATNLKKPKKTRGHSAVEAAAGENQGMKSKLADVLGVTSEGDAGHSQVNGDTAKA